MLSAILSSPLIVALLGGVVAAVAAYLRGRSSGAQREREKQAAAEAKARDLADEIQNDVGALPPDAAREELRKWSR